MEGFDNRHVCMSDLKKYLKRNDYLSGYTEIEKALVRQNIGVTSSSGSQDNDYIEGSYSEIEQIVLANQLVVGNKYIINDFQSIYISNTDDIWGGEINPSSLYKIVLTAISENQFDIRVNVISEKYKNSSKWIVEYMFDSELLKNSIKTKGRITYLRDEYNNSAYYDFKNIKFRRTQSELQKVGITIQNEYEDLYTFSNSQFEENSESINVFDNTFEINSTNNIIISDYCYNNIFSCNTKNNLFSNSCTNNTFFSETANNNFKDKVNHLIGNVYNTDFIDLNYTNSDFPKFIQSGDNTIITYIDAETLTLQQNVII